MDIDNNRVIIQLSCVLEMVKMYTISMIECDDLPGLRTFNYLSNRLIAGRKRSSSYRSKEEMMSMIASATHFRVGNHLKETPIEDDLSFCRVKLEIK